MTGDIYRAGVTHLFEASDSTSGFSLGVRVFLCFVALFLFSFMFHSNSFVNPEMDIGGRRSLKIVYFIFDLYLISFCVKEKMFREKLFCGRAKHLSMDSC